MAKIKRPVGHDYNPFKHKPRGVSHTSYKKVYWPYLPLLVFGVLIAGLISNAGGFGRAVHHSGSRVLGYATSISSQSLLSDTNNDRSSQNLPDLALNPELSAAAQAKANDMAKRDYWSHQTPSGQSPWTFVAAQNYAYLKLGENLATGFADSGDVISAWLASPTHRQNLLNSSFSDVGFGYANVADYKAAGGGPMTVVVAFYGQPGNSSLPVISSSDSATPPATTLTATNGAAIAASVSRVELTFAKWRFAPITTSVVLVIMFAALGVWLSKHLLAFRRAWVKSERFVIRHPAMDLFLFAIVALTFILSQTAGLIQ